MAYDAPNRLTNSAVRANGFGDVLLQAQGPNRDVIINAPVNSDNGNVTLLATGRVIRNV